MDEELVVRVGSKTAAVVWWVLAAINVVLAISYYNKDELGLQVWNNILLVFVGIAMGTSDWMTSKLIVLPMSEEGIKRQTLCPESGRTKKVDNEGGTKALG